MASTESEHRTSARLSALQAKLKARTDRSGNAQPGYKPTVEELRKEIAALEAGV